MRPTLLRALNIVVSNIFPTLSDHFWPADSANLLRAFILIFVGAILLTVSAKIGFTFNGMQQNLLLLAVCLLGYIYDLRCSLAAICLYYLQGILGLPLTTNGQYAGSGIELVTGPTGGFLVGHLLVAYLCSRFAQNGFDRKFLKVLIGTTVAVAMMYLIGLIWLGAIVGWEKPIMKWAMTPYLLGDMLKILIVSLSMPLLWKLLYR